MRPWWMIVLAACAEAPDASAPADPIADPIADSDAPVADSDAAPSDPTAVDGPCPDVPLALTYGTASGTFDFIPAPPGTRSRLTGGGQDAFHLWGSALIDGTAQQVRIDAQAVDVATGAVISEVRLFRGLVPLDGTAWACRGRAPGITHQIDFSKVDPRASPNKGWWALCGREVDLTATFVDPFTETVLISDTCRVIADPPEGFDACPGPPEP